MIDTPLAIIILAAGKGTRMKSTMPKVMQPLCGKPMINVLLDTLVPLNADKTIVVIGPDMDDVKRAVAPHDTVVQHDRNGTGGAAKIAADALGDYKGHVLILLGDAPLIKQSTLENLISACKGDQAGISLLACDVQNPDGYGRVIIQSDDIVDHIVEHKDANESERQCTLMNAGAFCVQGKYVSDWLSRITNDNAQGEYYVTDLPAIAQKDGFHTRAVIIRDETQIQGCNTLRDLALMEATYRLRLCDAHMDNGVRIIDPATTYIHHDTQIGEGTIIEPNVICDAGVVIDANAHIHAFSHLSGVHIASGASIGPYARLRPDTHIHQNAKVGSFVEVKKTVVGQGSKVPHLSYVGDAVIGENSNIGAGTITANYDGYAKHKTTIGDDVMTGVNVNLIAPVSIENGAYVAAGSTITKTVPAGSLGIAREKVTIKDGWADRYHKTKKVN